MKREREVIADDPGDWVVRPRPPTTAISQRTLDSGGDIQLNFSFSKLCISCTRKILVVWFLL